MRNLLLTLFLVSLIAQTASAYPEPAVVPGLNDWTLDVVFDQPRQITVQLPGDAKPQRFWYIILTLTNNSMISEAPFYPSCHLMTDTFQIVEAGRKARQQVFENIKSLYQGKYPFLEFIDNVDNKVLQGQDNARDICFIWPDFDANAKNISLFIGGLSNETTAIEHPTAKDENGSPKLIFLRKTLCLNYSIGGDPSLRNLAKLKFTDKKWIMR